MDWENVKKATRQRIVDVFWKINEEKLFSDISVKEICFAAKISRSTFYEYFKSVNELLETEENRILSEVGANPRIQTFNPEEFKGDTIKDSFIEIYRRNQCCFDALFSQYGDPRFMVQYKNVLKEGLIKNIRKAGYDHENLDLIIEYEISGMIGMVQRWFQTGRQQPFGEIVKLYGNLSLHGPVSFIITK